MIRNIHEVAKFIGLSLLSKGLSVSPLKLQKLLYYVQSWYMVAYGRENTLFAEAPQAWVNGPVYPCIYQKYKEFTDGMCDHLNASHFTSETDIEKELKRLSLALQFNADELETLDSVITLYGSKTQNELVFLTHCEKPWVEKREGLAPFTRSIECLSFDTMYTYYKERYERNHGKQ